MSIVKSTLFEPYIPSSYDKDTHVIMQHNNHYGNEGNIFFTKEEYKKYEDLVNSLLNQKVDTTLNGKVYLGKLSSLPRHKIKDYFKENNVNKTSRLDQSDTIILNREHLNEFNKIFGSSASWYKLKSCKVYKFDSSEDKDFIVKYAKSWYNTTFNLESQFSIVITDENKNKLTPKLTNFLQGRESEDLFYKSLYRDKNLVEVHNHLEHVIKNPNVKVIFDESIMDPLNEDGFELDEEYLTTLDGMFESKSQDNINLALEMLSNVNIEKNSLTIALFLNKHKNIFSWGSGLSVTKNNSFKSTLKYFKSKNINFESDWRTFSTNLLKLHKDNPKNVDIIKDFTLQNINMYLKQFSSDGKGFIELTSFNLALRD
jgi:hypothetical protein